MAQDIRRVQFTRGVRGYKEEEVDSFIRDVAGRMDELVGENHMLTQQNKSLQEEVERYRSKEHVVIETLDSAKALMGEISASAEKRAEMVVRNAEADAERIRREARESIEGIGDEAKREAQRYEQFRTRFRNLLQNELDRFDSLTQDLSGDSAALFYSDDPKWTQHGEHPSLNFHTGDYRAPGTAEPKGKTIRTNKRNGL
jgi:cell division initiation protein